jgi:hypothetical protein
MVDGAKFLNCKNLNGGRDRTRTCDLLRVKQSVEPLSCRSKLNSNVRPLGKPVCTTEVLALQCSSGLRGFDAPRRGP